MKDHGKLFLSLTSLYMFGINVPPTVLKMALKIILHRSRLQMNYFDFLSENKRLCYINWRFYLYRSLKLIYYNPILGQIKGQKPAQGIFMTIITLKMNFSKITEWSSHRFVSIISSSKKYCDYRKIWKFDFESRIVMRGWAKIES